MNVRQFLDHCNEQNWQVIDQNKEILNGSKGSSRSDSEGFKYDKLILEERVQSLKKAISILKTELLEEKALWKKEVELMASILSSSERCPENDLNIDLEMDIKPRMGSSVSQMDTLIATPVIRDFEEKINRYQGALAQVHAEKRINMRRQIAANTYRKRLNEVEKLCQEELNKVRETATYLEPLKQIASEWNKTRPHYPELLKTPALENLKKTTLSNSECGGDFQAGEEKEVQSQDENYTYEVPVKQIDASLVMDEDASSEIKGKIVLQIGSLPSEVPTICYSAKFE